MADVDLIKLGYKPLHTNRVQSIDALTHAGIDGVFVKDGQFIVVETKYGTAGLSTANDGRQISNNWIESSDRLFNAVGGDLEREILRDGYNRVLARVQPDGSIKYSLVDVNGFVIQGPGGTFIP